MTTYIIDTWSLESKKIKLYPISKALFSFTIVSRQLYFQHEQIKIKSRKK